IQNLPLCLAAIFVAQVASMTYAGPSFATIQSLAPPEMHAAASAIYLFALSGVGLSLGPLLVGALSDLFQAYGWSNPLRWAIIIAAAPQALAALHLMFAARSLRRAEANAGL